MGSALEKLDKVLSFIEDWVLYLAVMVGLISLTVNVYLRYIHNYSLAWSEELIRHIIILTTFLGLSAAVKNGSMITIDALVQMVPRLRKPLTYVSHAAVIIFALMMIYYGWQAAMQKFDTFQETIILEIPLGYLFCILPLAGVMMLLRTFQVLYKDYKEAKSEKADE